MSFSDTKQREKIVCLNEAPFFGLSKGTYGWVEMQEGTRVFGRRGLVSLLIWGGLEAPSQLWSEYGLSHVAQAAHLPSQEPRAKEGDQCLDLLFTRR